MELFLHAKLITWNGTVFEIETVLHKTKLFEIELFWHLIVSTQKLNLKKLNCSN